MIIFSTKNLCKTYSNGKVKVDALKDVNLSIKRGSFNAIIGKSGSGKSTLLNILGGMDAPTHGEVIVEGTDIYKQSDTELAAYRRKRAGFVFQAYNLLSEFSIFHNICMPSYLDGLFPNEEYVMELSECLGIKHKLDSFPNELSGGEQQRAALARALSMKPALIFADEPTGNLDNKSGNELFSLLKMSQENFNQTIVMATHDLSIVKAVDRVITLEDGRVVNDVEGIQNE